MLRCLSVSVQTFGLERYVAIILAKVTLIDVCAPIRIEGIASSAGAEAAVVAFFGIFGNAAYFPLHTTQGMPSKAADFDNGHI